jgi:hypothetical protein
MRFKIDELVKSKKPSIFVIPAKAGHLVRFFKPIGATVALSRKIKQFWTPAFAGVTCLGTFTKPSKFILYYLVKSGY